MALATFAVTATASPTPVNATEIDAVGGHSIEVTVPTGGQTVYVGGPDVAASGATVGRAVTAGASFAFDLDPREQAYLVVASGSQTVTVFATGI